MQNIPILSTGSNGPVNSFDQWAAAGFGPDLLPIIPVDAVMSAQSTVSPENRGKVPGKRDDRYGTWHGFRAWQDHKATADDHTRWGGSGAGVGLQARRWPGVDIDVTEEAMSAALAGIARFMLGEAPERAGRAPKRLLAYALAPGETVRKRRVEFTLPSSGAEKHAVEVLGDGQQYVVEGVHPKTARPYSWDRPPVASGLTPITAAQVDAFMDQVARAVVAMGGTIFDRPPAGSGSEPPADQSSLRGDPCMIAEALRVAGNDFGYDEWIKMVAAIKAALGADEAHYGVYENWCLAYPGNDAAVARRKWDSVRPPYRVGANYVYEAAETKGWTGRVAAAGFTPVPGASAASGAAGADDWEDVFPCAQGASGDPVPYWARQYAYASKQERFVCIADGETMTEAQFARRMATPAISVTSVANPAKAFFQSPFRRMADHLTYLPGRGPFPVIDGKRCVNVWREPAIMATARARGATVQDADIAPWLDHAANLIPDPAERTTILDWMAYVIQHPGEKPNWAVFLGGAQGIGKDTMFRPLVAAMGAGNVSEPGTEDVGGQFNGWLLDKRLIVVQEMQAFQKRNLMDRLKPYITRPPTTILAHRKGIDHYNVPNVAAFVFMSNHDDALALEKGDRRYFVCWSPMTPAPQTYYDALYGWLEAGGIDAVVAWLSARKLVAFNAQGRAPDTTAKAAMIAASRPGWQQDLKQAMDAGAEPFDTDLFRVEDVQDWLRKAHGARTPTPKAITTALRDFGAEKLTQVDLSKTPLAAFGRPMVWAVRSGARYRALTPAQLRETFVAGQNRVTRAFWPQEVTPGDVEEDWTGAATHKDYRHHFSPVPLH